MLNYNDVRDNAMMPCTQVERLIRLEENQEISKGNQEAFKKNIDEQSKKIDELHVICRNIEAAFLGDIGSQKIGFMELQRNTSKDIQELKVKVERLEKQDTENSEFKFGFKMISKWFVVIALVGWELLKWLGTASYHYITTVGKPPHP